MLLTMPLEIIDDDSLARILAYLEFDTAIRFCRCVSRAVSERLLCKDHRIAHVWKQLFQSAGFSMQDANHDDYVETYRERKRLMRNLLQPLAASYCFSLHPMKFFSFLPILPDEYYTEEIIDDNNGDPPPVYFECESYRLTSSGTSEEFVLLNPFDATLSVFASVLDRAVQQNDPFSDHDALPASQHQLQHPCKQQFLITAQDYFDMDMNDYFDPRAFGNDPEFEVGYLGIDVKHYSAQSSGMIDTCIALGRTISLVDNDLPQLVRGGDQSPSLVEMLLWFRGAGSGDALSYGDKHVCRFSGNDFFLIEVSPLDKRIYVSYLQGDGLNQGGPIYAYPMLPEGTCHQKPHDTKPCFVLNDMNESITTTNTAALGTVLMVSTVSGKLLIYSLAAAEKPVRIHTIDLPGVFERCCGYNAADDESPSVHVHGDSRSQRFSWHRAGLQCIVVPQHASSLELNGFVTLQHDATQGSRILLWQYQQEWRVLSMINLPLSPRRRPQVHYDGIRLVVFGEDHIGFIILVYHVTNVSSVNGVHTQSRTTEDSGGVTNMHYPGSHKMLRYSNRIRHVALSGIPPYESLYMTCNERFIVINTKAGNLLPGSLWPYGDGLLVIDLDQEDKVK